MSSHIQWTDETWNPTTGCTRVSAGCDNCYAVRMTKRLAGQFEEYQGLVNPGKDHFNGTVKLHEDRLEKPLHWRKPRRVFVNSMSDLFHPEVPFEFVDKVWAVMALCPQHTFQVLTKRPERMGEYLQEGRGHRVSYTVPPGQRSELGRIINFGWPLPNVWIGTSVEDQEAADKRIPHLLRCPAAVRFLSCEPLLGPVHLRPWIGPHCGCHPNSMPEPCDEYARTGRCGKTPSRIQWVIVGGESGPGARPCNVEWIRDLLRQCGEAGVAAFVKQLGAEAVGPWRQEGSWSARDIYDFSDRKGGDPSEWPEDLQVREYPEVAR